MKRFVLFGAVTVAAVLGLAGPASAEKAATSNGVGVCLSQVAIDPSLVGLNNLGEHMRTLGGTTPSELDGLRNACGEPPGPGHLGG